MLEQGHCTHTSEGHSGASPDVDSGQEERSRLKGVAGLSHQRWGEHAQIEAARATPLLPAECGFTPGHVTSFCKVLDTCSHLHAVTPRRCAHCRGCPPIRGFAV